MHISPATPADSPARSSRGHDATRRSRGGGWGVSARVANVGDRGDNNLGAHQVGDERVHMQKVVKWDLLFLVISESSNTRLENNNSQYPLSFTQLCCPRLIAIL